MALTALGSPLALTALGSTLGSPLALTASLATPLLTALRTAEAATWSLSTSQQSVELVVSDRARSISIVLLNHVLKGLVAHLDTELSINLLHLCNRDLT